MKNTKAYLYVLLGVFLFASCTNNDDTTNFENDIKGLWRLMSLESQNAYDFNNDGEPTTNMLFETKCYLNEKIIFNADNTANFKASSYAEIVGKLIPGTNNSYTYTAECIKDERLKRYNWTINESNIVIIDGDDIQLHIVPETSKQFSFIYNKALVVNKSSDQTVIIEEDLKFTFEKQ